MEASHGMAFGTAVMGGKATLKPDNLQPVHLQPLLQPWPWVAGFLR